MRGGVTLGSPIAIGIANRDFANWERVMGPLAGGPVGGGREAADAAAPRARRPGRRHEVRRAGPARRPRARLGARVRRARRGRRGLQDSSRGVRHRGPERRPLASATPSTAPRRAPSPPSSASARTRRCGRSIAEIEKRMVAAVDAARQRGGDARRLDSRRRARRAAGPRAPTPRGTESSTAASGRRSCPCPPSRRSSSGARSKPRAGPAPRAHDEIERGPDGRLAPAHEPGRRARSGRDQRRGLHRRRRS